MKTLFENARLIDPASGLDRIGDLAVADGRIVAVGTAPAGFEPQQRIAAHGAVLLPGLIDLHARLRPPGSAPEGGIASELDAAAAGGVTLLVCPPDTDPTRFHFAGRGTIAARGQGRGLAGHGRCVGAFAAPD